MHRFVHDQAEEEGEEGDEYYFDDLDDEGGAEGMADFIVSDGHGERKRWRSHPSRMLNEQAALEHDRDVARLAKRFAAEEHSQPRHAPAPYRPKPPVLPGYQSHAAPPVASSLHPPRRRPDGATSSSTLMSVFGSNLDDLPPQPPRRGSLAPDLSHARHAPSNRAAPNKPTVPKFGVANPVASSSSAQRSLSHACAGSSHSSASSAPACARQAQPMTAAQAAALLRGHKLPDPERRAHKVQDPTLRAHKVPNHPEQRDHTLHDDPGIRFNLQAQRRALWGDISPHPVSTAASEPAVGKPPKPASHELFEPATRKVPDPTVRKKPSEPAVYKLPVPGGLYSDKAVRTTGVAKPPPAYKIKKQPKQPPASTATAPPKKPRGLKVQGGPVESESSNAQLPKGVTLTQPLPRPVPSAMTAVLEQPAPAAREAPSTVTGAREQTAPSACEAPSAAAAARQQIPPSAREAPAALEAARERSVPCASTGAAAAVDPRERLAPSTREAALAATASQPQMALSLHEAAAALEPEQFFPSAREHISGGAAPSSQQQLAASARGKQRPLSARETPSAEGASRELLASSAPNQQSVPSLLVNAAPLSSSHTIEHTSVSEQTPALATATGEQPCRKPSLADAMRVARAARAVTEAAVAASEAAESGWRFDGGFGPSVLQSADLRAGELGTCEAADGTPSRVEGGGAVLAALPPLTLSAGTLPPPANRLPMPGPVELDRRADRRERALLARPAAAAEAARRAAIASAPAVAASASALSAAGRTTQALPPGQAAPNGRLTLLPVDDLLGSRSSRDPKTSSRPPRPATALSPRAARVIAAQQARAADERERREQALIRARKPRLEQGLMAARRACAK